MHPELERILNLSDEDTRKEYATWLKKAQAEGLKNIHLTVVPQNSITVEGVMREMLALDQGSDLGLWSEFSEPFFLMDEPIPNNVKTTIETLTFNKG